MYVVKIIVFYINHLLLIFSKIRLSYIHGEINVYSSEVVRILKYIRNVCSFHAARLLCKALDGLYELVYNYSSIMYA